VKSQRRRAEIAEPRVKLHAARAPRALSALRYGTCFITGAAILVLEVLGFRLFAPYFGSSVYVTGTLIGIVLAALSLGYVIGGSLADRRPEERIMYAAILAAAIYLAVVLLVYRALLEALQTWGLVAGTLAAACAIFVPPMLALSIVSPYLVRLAAVHERVGSVAGQMFAVSTLGSIAGSFLATFVLVPGLGSHATLLGCVLVLVLLGAGGLWWTTGRTAPALVAALLFVPSYTPHDPSVVLRKESAYNTIEVRDADGLRVMTLNRSRWRQSYLARPDEELPETYREYFLLAPFLTEVRDVLILGASAGASLTEFQHYFPVAVDAVDIDPEVLRLAEEYFGVRRDADTRLVAADARPFLATATRRWDFVEIDLFHGGPDMPFYVATQEFFALVRARLAPRGVVMMNVLGSFARNRDELVRAVGRTMATVFPSVYAMPFSGNTVLVAMGQQTDLAALRTRLETVTTENLRPLAATMRDTLQVLPADDGPPLTDDHAPVEQMTHRLLLRLGEG
jgi:spermidine synthase